MIRSRLGLKALFLSGLVLGLMAMSSSAAQASEAAAKWLLDGVDIGANRPQLVIKEIEGKTASLEFTTKGGTNVLILCTTAEFDEGGKLEPEGKLSLGRIKFKGCVTLLNEVVSAACKPAGGGTAAKSGEILSLKGKGEILLDETKERVKISPDEGTKFAVIELGATCAIGETVNVEGSLWIRDCNNQELVDAIEHLIVEATGASLEGLKALGQPAKILGSAWMILGAPFTGHTFAGHAG